MDLQSVIDSVRRNEKTLTVFNAERGESIEADLSAYFEARNVRVETRRTRSGAPRDVAVLSDADSVLAIVDVDRLETLLGEVPHGPGGFGIDDEPYADVLRHVQETTFTAYDVEQLLNASYEIEDRAFRVGNGRLVAGFQRCSLMRAQRVRYDGLAGRGIDVHAIGYPDVEPPDLSGVHVHPVEAPEIAATWVVAFDGGGDERQKSALVARERSEGEYYGIVTYDPAIVDDLVDYLVRTYVRPDDTAADQSV